MSDDRPWPWQRIPRGTLTDWSRLLPQPRSPLACWLRLQDALAHDDGLAYAGRPITDPAWRLWMDARDQPHAIRVIEQLAAAGLMVRDGDRIVAIPDVDAVRAERAARTAQARENGRRRAATSRPRRGHDAAGSRRDQIMEQNQRAGATDAERPGDYIDIDKKRARARERLRAHDARFPCEAGAEVRASALVTGT